MTQHDLQRLIRDLTTLKEIADELLDAAIELAGKDNEQLEMFDGGQPGQVNHHTH